MGLKTDILIKSTSAMLVELREENHRLALELVAARKTAGIWQGETLTTQDEYHQIVEKLSKENAALRGDLDRVLRVCVLAACAGDELLARELVNAGADCVIEHVKYLDCLIANSKILEGGK